MAYRLTRMALGKPICQHSNQ